VPEPPAWLAELPERPAAAEEAAQAEPEVKAVSGLEEPAATEIEASGPPPDAETPVAEQVPDWVRHMQEAVTQEAAPVGAEALPEATSAAVAPADDPRGLVPAGVGEAVRERMLDLLVQLQENPRKHWARIELARLCCQARDWDGALLHYEELIASRKMGPAVIHDLEGLLQEEVDKVQVYRLLGDAYMESDEIDQALEMYRLARQILRKR
jgi:tetratricopeptide (TPR) repeat protein